jgi:UPF0716 protein FxsA
VSAPAPEAGARLSSLSGVFLIVIALIVVPLLEIWVILKVGGAIGTGPTIFLLVFDSLLGALLLRHQGRAAWVSFNRALNESRIPAKEAIDGVLVIFGAALLLTPGFITDIFGFVLLIPPTRAIVRSMLKWFGLSRLSMGPRAAVWGAGRVNNRGGRGPGPEPAEGRARGGDPFEGAEDFSWTSPSGPRPGDIEGTAHEVRDDDEALPPGRSTSFPG